MRRPKSSDETRALSLFARAIQRLLYDSADGDGYVSMTTTTADAAGLARAIARLHGATTGERRLLARAAEELLSSEAVAIESSETIRLDARTRRERGTKRDSTSRNDTISAGIFSVSGPRTPAVHERGSRTDASQRNNSGSQSNKRDIPQKTPAVHERGSRTDASQRNNSGSQSNKRDIPRGAPQGEECSTFRDARTDATPRNHDTSSDIPRRETVARGIAIAIREEIEELGLSEELRAATSVEGWWLDPVTVGLVVQVVSEGRVTLGATSPDPVLQGVLRRLTEERPSLGAELLWWAFLARTEEDGWHSGDRDRRRLLGSIPAGGELPAAKGLRGCLERASTALLAHQAKRARERRDRSTEARASSSAPKFAEPSVGRPAVRDLVAQAKRLAEQAKATRDARDAAPAAPDDNEGAR